MGNIEEYLRYEKLLSCLEFLKQNNQLDLTSIYIGDINGSYERHHYHINDNQIDGIITNGNISKEYLDITKQTFEISDADFIIRLTKYEENDKNYIFPNINILLDREYLSDLLKFLQEENLDYLKQIKTRLNLIDIKDTKSGISITPSKELMKENGYVGIPPLNKRFDGHIRIKRIVYKNKS